MQTTKNFFPLRRSSIRDESTESTDGNFNYIDPMRDLDSQPNVIPAKGTPAPFTQLWNEQVRNNPKEIQPHRQKEEEK